MRYRFLQDNEGQWYAIPVERYDDFMRALTDGTVAQFYPERLIFHLSGYSFVDLKQDIWLTPLRGGLSHPLEDPASNPQK